MIKRIKPFLLSLMVIASIQSAAAITLDEVIVLALDRHQAPLNELERNRLNDARAHANGWKYAMRPNLNVNHDGDDWVAQRVGVDANIEMGNRGTLFFGVSRQHLTASDEDVDQHSIEYALPLFRRPLADELNHPAAIDRQIEQLQRDLIRSQQEMVLGIAELYHHAVVSEEEAHHYQSVLVNKQKRYDLAADSQSERVQALSVGELELAEARWQAESAQIEATDARRQLEALIGASLNDGQLQPSTSLGLPEELEALIAIALTNRLDYADTLTTLTEAYRKAQRDKRNVWPPVTLRLGYSASQFSGSSSSEDQSERFNFGVSAGDIWRRDDENTQGRYDLERARIERSLTEQRVRSEVTKAYLVVQRENRQLEIAQMRTSHYSRQSTGMEKLFRLGRIAYDEVKLVQARQAEAALASLRQQQQVVLAEYRLKAALGTLVEAPQYLLPAKAQNDESYEVDE